MFSRAQKLLSLSQYSMAGGIGNSRCWFWEAPKYMPTEQKILRMCVRAGGEIKVPNELKWLNDHIHDCNNHHNHHFPEHAFIYVTVRIGVVDTHTDDMWHVDGFSMRKPHLPEQNYIWVDKLSDQTEFIDRGWKIPNDFDPLKHNLHWWFQDQIASLPMQIHKATPGYVYVIDPYIVHRRPPQSFGKQRAFVRVSFVPIEIESADNTPNPLLPRPKFKLPDFRLTLSKYTPPRP